MKTKLSTLEVTMAREFPRLKARLLKCTAGRKIAQRALKANRKAVSQ